MQPGDHRCDQHDRRTNGLRQPNLEVAAGPLKGQVGDDELAGAQVSKCGCNRKRAMTIQRIEELDKTPRRTFQSPTLLVSVQSAILYR